ncbi:MAG: V-type ATP synthase subunit D [Methanolinea sp.]|jgi:V/A-type H+-transporting ATPase subunit D|nr:V-type ATP synthase subunit D [Methanolinea sp.]
MKTLANVAQHSLLIALAVDDPITLKSASFATRSGITLDIKGKNIVGVPVPIIEKKRFVKGLMKRSCSILGVSGRIDEAAEKYGAELDLIISLAETETSIRRISSEIQMTRRIANALEQVLIPELTRQAKYIEITIDEREREDLYRLKKSEEDHRSEEEGRCSREDLMRPFLVSLSRP